MMLILSCFVVSLSCVVQAGPSEWADSLNDIKEMRMCGIDMFNINDVNAESVKMQCENATGFDESLFWRMFKGVKMQTPVRPKQEGEGKPKGWPQVGGLVSTWKKQTWPQPDGPASSLKKPCDFMVTGEESFEDDLDVEDDIELMKPEKLRKKMKVMKKKMMKMNCEMSMMKMFSDIYRKKQEDYNYIKGAMAQFPGDIITKYTNNELCKGTKMGYLDTSGTFLKDAMMEKVEKFVFEKEEIRRGILERLEACAVNEEPTMVYMCIGAECIRLQRLYGKRYTCVEA